MTEMYCEQTDICKHNLAVKDTLNNIIIICMD
jgi:hypothetical protein